MKITIENEAVKVIIINEGLVSIGDVVQELVRPALIGVGFHPDSVDEYLVTEYQKTDYYEDLIL